MRDRAPARGSLANHRHALALDFLSNPISCRPESTQAISQDGNAIDEALGHNAEEAIDCT